MHTSIGPTRRRLTKYNLLLHSTRMDVRARAMKRSEKAWRPVRAPVMNRFVSVVARLIAAVPAAADDQAVCFDETSRPEIAITACSKVDDTCKALRHDLAALYHGRAYLFREQGRR